MRHPIRTGTALLTSCSAVLLFSGACQSSEGEIVFGVTTEIPGGIVLTRVETSLKVDGSEIDTASYEGASLDFPFEVPSGPQPEGSLVELRLEGYAGPDRLVTRTAAATVVSDRKILLEVALEDECIGVDCGDGETCISGSCSDPLENAERLPEYYDNWAGGETGDRCEPGGAPLVLIGEGQSDYHPIEDGAVLDVEAGPQGGYHVWIAVRIKNLRQSGSVTEVTGTFPALDYSPPPLQVVFTFDPDEGDYCKLFGLRFRLDDADHPIESLLGETLELRVRISDQDEDVGEATATVVLSDDPP
ncbi:MAG: hypothetical protein JNK04_16795 [Myxococcales bacterium]|nr:hypothetical protein [Myxococcales bacterium]